MALQALIDLQDDVHSRIVRLKSNFKKTSKERLKPEYIETCIESLEKQWVRFETTHTKIICEIPKAERQESLYYKNNVCDTVEDMYVELKSLMKVKLAECNESLKQKSIVTTSEVAKIKLPQVKIPIFSGKYSEWLTFRDLFIGLVHKNPTLDNAQRLYYLKGHLSGEAQQILNNINITADNYEASWAKLQAMYNNKRFLANGILNRLINQKSITTESAAEIKRIICTTTECLESIKNLGVDIETWDIIIIHLTSAKLDKETRKAWELHIASLPGDNLPKLSEFTEFLTGRFRGLENLDTRVSTGKTCKSFHIIGKDKKEPSCLYCSASHKITQCKRFTNESNDARRNFAQEKGLCFVCMGINHSAKYCRNTAKCYVCRKRHHTLLHPSGGSGSVVENSSEVLQGEVPTSVDKTGSSSSVDKGKAATEAEGSEKQIFACHALGIRRDTVLLPTALVKAESKCGEYRLVRALIDQGSQGSFITEAMTQYLGLRKTSTEHLVTGVGGNKSILSKYTVKFYVRSRVNPNFKMQVQAYVLKTITSLLPVAKVTWAEWEQLRDKDLADPHYDQPNKIDLLLGADTYSQIISDGVQRNGSLLAQATTLGWIVSGVIERDDSSKVDSHTCITVMHVSVQDNDELLRKFWEMEESNVSKKLLTPEETECENYYTATTRRDSTGRYIVRLPFRNGLPMSEESGSRVIAEKRLKNLEYSLAKDNNLHKEYINVLHEYIKLNHMVRVTQEEFYEGMYLPHHAVVRDDKQTTKVRVVFDASCKGNNGISLNDKLMIGPTLQADLRHIVMRWRRHKICLSADIIKMYRQVLVDREDTRFQRILWRDSPEEKIEEFELITVTFGTASAPYLAVRSLHQVAYDECKNDPEIREIILKDFYIDDLMTGAESVEKAIRIQKRVKAALSNGGFKLQKWMSNNQDLLNVIKVDECTGDERVIITVDNITKILGLTWSPCDDCFQFSVELPPVVEPVTKRKIISDISRLFDPLGWLAPCIIVAKIFIQKLWLAGLTWDQEVPINLVKEWKTYRDSLDTLMQIRIPRWYYTSSQNIKVELHGFSDASKLAYAAVVYIRVIDNTGNINVSLVAAKTKVAPIKQVSVPRLELCGAVLLSKLIDEVGQVMDVPKVDWHMWTDSEVVLAWLQSHPSRWKTFVANRTSEILTSVDSQQWSHVPTKVNPADLASRGMSPTELQFTSVWWNGPDFLKHEVIDYRKPKNNSTKLEEVKVHISVVDYEIWNRYSSLSRLVRVIAYCRRFLKFKQKRSRYLNKQELEEALQTCIKRVQEERFAEELKELKQNKGVERKKSNLKSLNIFLDHNGIIRVGGRLEMSKLEYDRIHPILIPKESFLTGLLIADAHDKTMHGGPQAMLRYLRSTYWIMGVKLLVKAYYRKCVTCLRYSDRNRAQLMGQLPTSRVTPQKPFLGSGVDYAGPINVRVSKGRGNKSYKGYIALFVCMSTRAIHLEVVSDLTSRGFLAAFKRFVARRGRCAELHSDNGSNFVGAARELQELFCEEKSTILPEITEALANNGVQWRFIPPHAPNFGGLWEAGVKSTKHHLRRVVGNSTLTYEELATVLAQIEACLNSRPLSYIEEEDGPTVLTPGHFLVGEPLILAPDQKFEESNIGTLRRWQLTQRMVQDFWRRWSQEYLQQFLQRHRWAYQSPEPSVGDVVLVKEDDLPPGKWLLGLIEQKHPGPDGITRVVTLRVKNSFIKRPVSKLCVLPVAK